MPCTEELALPDSGALWHLVLSTCRCQVVHVTDNTLIQSDGSVEMSNMHFIVYPGVNLLVHAKDVIRITRGKVKNRLDFCLCLSQLTSRK